jgi:hypothetical protein
MKVFVLIIVSLFLLVPNAFAQKQKVESVYTSLKTEKCKTIESSSDEGGSYRGVCAGTGGYKLEVLEGDIRQTINVIAPGGKKHELNLWSVVSSGFSSLGDNAEWRIVKKSGKTSPTALIVRFNVSDNPEDSSKITSYLVIIKITAKEICVTDIVKPTAGSNQKARELADNSATRSCKTGPN